MLKCDLIKEPDLYLRSQIMKHHLSDHPSKTYWAMGSEKYIKDAIRQVKEWLAERNGVLKTKAPDMIYIKTQVFRLLRYYSPAPRNIARSDWATKNITHNMTSSIIQPYGLHSL